ncbi:MAG: protein kinase [Chloracidobacterium sp.]|nr:protein kinase [Chloracidobacterium sp.]
MKPLAPNSMIQNRYLIVQMIGKGGMGEVYLAVDQRLGSAVALKRTFFNDNQTLGSAFEREARILGRLRHPVLPKVIDHFAENGDQFLVMEHISGDDLAKRLETAAEPFPLNWVMFWADQMLDALSYLHSHEPPIVHRDIKPQNLKLTDENHIVLLDFGLSKDFDTNSAGNSLNSASVAGYSPHFAAMEQIRGTGTDARSDLYSFSATLYQLLTNTIPADALTRADALLGGQKDPIIPLYEVNPAISPAISEVILKGAELRQDQRYSSASEMQKALRRAFKQGKDEDVNDLKTLEMTVDAVVVPAAPQTNPSEMATRAQPASEPPPSPLIAASKDSVPATTSQPKQSDLRTEVLPPKDIDSEIATRITSQPKAAAAEVNPMPSPAVQVNIPKAASPKGSSKSGLIIGALIGLLLLGVIGGGVGWYYYSKNKAAVQPKPTPTPAVVAPSPSPTPEMAVESDQNSNSNSNTAVVEVNTETDTPSQNSSTTSVPGTVKPQQPGTKNVPGRTAQPPATKSTPKSKPRSDDRTVILQ